MLCCSNGRPRSHRDNVKKGLSSCDSPIKVELFVFKYISLPAYVDDASVTEDLGELAS